MSLTSDEYFALTTGQNKSFTYNLLNLPQVATFPTGTSTYTYDSTGQKLRKVNLKSGVTVTTDYINGIEYDNSTTTIGFIQTEEGKAVPNGTGYDYTYYLGDNLGNTRITFGTKTGSAVTYQQDDYYPFGMEINTPPVTNPKNEYLYNKKELQEELTEYDYGARFYDPVIARWNTVDPLAEKSRRWSPYNYVMNNPIRMIDPDGMSILDRLKMNDPNAEDAAIDNNQYDQDTKRISLERAINGALAGSGDSSIDPNTGETTPKPNGNSSTSVTGAAAKVAGGIASVGAAVGKSTDNKDASSSEYAESPQRQINIALSPDNFNFQEAMGSDWQAAGVKKCRFILTTLEGIMSSYTRVIEFNIEVGLPVYSEQLGRTISRREAQNETAAAYYKAVLEVNQLYVNHGITDAAIPKRIATLMQIELKTSLKLLRGKAVSVSNILGTNFGAPVKFANYTWKISDIIGL